MFKMSIGFAKISAIYLICQKCQLYIWFAKDLSYIFGYRKISVIYLAGYYLFGHLYIWFPNKISYIIGFAKISVTCLVSCKSQLYIWLQRISLRFSKNSRFPEKTSVIY